MDIWNRFTRQAILTFDNDSRIRAEVTLRLKKWYTHADYERELLEAGSFRIQERGRR